MPVKAGLAPRLTLEGDRLALAREQDSRVTRLDPRARVLRVIVHQNAVLADEINLATVADNADKHFSGKLGSLVQIELHAHH